MTSAPSLQVTVSGSRVHIGDRFSVSFQRTLRIPDDGQRYPLPPGLGLFPVQRASDFAGQGPEAWRGGSDLFIPMYQREALWLGFDAAPWKPNAVKVGVGRINAITGTAWSLELTAAPQDYIVCPDQPWLDGIKVGPATVRQFVATPLGRGLTIEGQLTGVETFGGIQLVVYEPRAGRFPDSPPPLEVSRRAFAAAPKGMGLAAGGALTQKIYPDRYGGDTWDPDQAGAVTVHIVNTEQYRAITGLTPPSTPISAHLYAEHHLPWFALYDEQAADVPAGERLASVKSLDELTGESHDSIQIDERDIRKLGPR